MALQSLQLEVGSRERGRASWRGLRIYGIDGSSIRVPNSDENRERFGGHNPRGIPSGYPMVCIAVLMVLRSHLLAAASFGRYEGVHEVEYAKPLIDSIPRVVADDSRPRLPKRVVLAQDRRRGGSTLAHPREKEHQVQGHQATRARGRVGRDDGVSTRSLKGSVTASYLGSSSHPL